MQNLQRDKHVIITYLYFFEPIKKGFTPTNMLSTHDELITIYQKVYNFITTNRLILYGGMATDYLLKFKGQVGIYSDDEEPDYDFYTPNMSMAYDLADILAKDHTGVHVINAWHPQTLKVKWNKYVVADMSYMPKDIFDTIPNINFMKNLRPDKKMTSPDTLRLTHPKFKMVDIHRALISPTRACPNEVVFQRFLKDMVRYNLLDKAFPDEPVQTVKRVKVSFELPTSKSEYLITSLFAYCLITKEFMDIFGESETCDFIKIRDLGKMSYEVEELDDVSSSFVVTDYKDFVKSSDKLEFRAPWMDDLLPRSVKTSNMTFYEFSTSVTYHQLGKNKVLNVHGVMLYFITKAFMDKSFKKSAYYQYYLSLKNIIAYVQEPFLNGTKNELGQESPFFVNMNVWKEVESVEYLIKKNELYNRANLVRDSPWPLPTYQPGKERPQIQDHILLYVGYEVIRDFEGYRKLLRFGDVF